MALTSEILMAPRKVLNIPLKSAVRPPEVKLAGKPPIPPELSTAPRADNSMADGSTLGNYKQADSAVGAGSGPQTGVTDNGA